MPGIQVLLVIGAYDYYQPLSQLVHDTYADFSFSMYGKLFDELPFLTSW